MNTEQTTPPVAPARRRWRDRLLLQEDLNFLLTNRVPRIALTRLMGWYSRIESTWLTRVSIAIWRLFTDLDLSEAQPRTYRSLRECFIRELRPGLRPIDPNPAVWTSPCDAIVGACGTVQDGQVLQAKGMAYPLAELLGSAALAGAFQGGTYVTLRLTSSMYHRFHAPCDARLEQVNYIAGDTWNVNPIALARVERLFCRNVRAVLRLRAEPDGAPLLVVPVAAILVASLRLHALNLQLHVRWRGSNRFHCDVPVRRGEELGWFEHGSTVVLLAPPGHTLAPGLAPGQTVRMGQALLSRPCRQGLQP